MIVVTRQPDFKAKGCLVVNSIEAALLLAKVRDENEVFIIGGAEIYAQVLPLADRLYLTLVEAEVEADTFFPAYEEGVWVEQEVITLTADEKNQFAFTFKTLKRNENC
jgi:dihydrofolate reductase